MKREQSSLERENSLPAYGLFDDRRRRWRLRSRGRRLFACASLRGHEELRSSESLNEEEEGERDLLSEKFETFIREGDSLFQPTGLL